MGSFLRRIKCFKLAPTWSSACAVPSAVGGLTSVFGMRTGVPLPPKHQLKIFNSLYLIVCSSPDIVSGSGADERIRTNGLCHDWTTLYRWATSAYHYTQLNIVSIAWHSPNILLGMVGVTGFEPIKNCIGRPRRSTLNTLLQENDALR